MLRIARRNPIERFNQRERNSEPWPQSCINEKARDENKANSPRIGSNAKLFRATEKDAWSILAIRHQSPPIGNKVESTCQVARALLRLTKDAMMKSERLIGKTSWSEVWSQNAAIDSNCQKRTLNEGKNIISFKLCSNFLDFPTSLPPQAHDSNQLLAN